MPALALKVAPLLETLKQAYRSFTGGQFGECKTALSQIIASIPLVAAASRSEANDLKELLDVAREYMTAVRIKGALDEASQAEGGDVVRSLELSAYFTHCNLQPSHSMLALKTAMANAFKAKVRLEISLWEVAAALFSSLQTSDYSHTLHLTHTITTELHQRGLFCAQIARAPRYEL